MCQASTVVHNAKAQHINQLHMGSFSDNVRKRYSGAVNKNNIEFECHNCLKMFSFEYRNITLNSFGDIEFDPEPECPRCGSTVDITFSDYGQHKIETMLTKGQIKTKE
jgi:hypothetical protein